MSAVADQKPHNSANTGSNAPQRNRRQSNNTQNSNKRHGGQNNQDRSNNNRRQNQPGNKNLRHGAARVQEELLTASQKRRRPSDNDIAMLLKSGALIGSATVSTHMKGYMFDAKLCQMLAADYQERAARNNARNAKQAQLLGTVESAFDMRATWNQLNLAAVALAGVVDASSQILFVASNDRAGVAVSRAASQLKSQSIIGRFVPGTLSNPHQKTFIEPTWMVCASASEDVQAIKETASSNTAVIAFADATSNLTNIDIAIGCNTRSRLSIGLMFYLLIRQTLRHKGVIPFDSEIEGLMVDHFIQQKHNKNAAEEEEEEAEAEGNQQQEQADVQNNELKMEGAAAMAADSNWDE